MKTCINIPFTCTSVRFMEVAGCTSRATQIPVLAWCRWSGFLYSNTVKKKKHFNLMCYSWQTTVCSPYPSAHPGGSPEAVAEGRW